MIALTDKDGNPVSAEGYTFTSETPEIATVSGNRVTGVSIGRARITVSGPAETSLEIPVVGENLLTREGVRNGAFEDGVLYGDAGDKFWEVAKTGDYMVGDNYSCEVVSATGGAGVETNVLKLTSTGLASGKKNMRFSLRSKYTEPVAGKQSGGVTLDPNKLYELTGWVMAENTQSLHNDWSVRTYYYAKNSSGSYKTFNDATNSTSVRPWDDATGDQEWTYFATKTLANNALSAYSLLLQPRIEGNKTVAKGG